jgi:hypothetical protein
MIIKALHTFSGTLDLSALERLQESNPLEAYPFRLYIKPGESIYADDKFYALTSIQNAIKLGYIEIGDVGNTTLNTSLVDHTYHGTTITQIAGESLSNGDLVYYRDDAKVYKAKADSTDTMLCMGICTTNVSANVGVVVLIDGIVRNSSVFNFTTGGQISKTNSLVYVDENIAGRTSQYHPVGSGHISQIIGYAITEDTLSFKPDHTYIEVK